MNTPEFEAPGAVEVMKLFDVSVDETIATPRKLKSLIRFLLRYGIHGAPREDMMKSVKQEQLELYFSDMELELSNQFPSFLEYNTTSDLAWQTWQYINSYSDWVAKKKDEGLKHTLMARFTGDKHYRGQPAEDSEGMILYKKILAWFDEFKKHDEYKGKVREEANAMAKDRGLLPKWTAEKGPKKYVKRPRHDDEDIDDEDIPEVPEGDEYDSHLFAEAYSRNMSRTGQVEQGEDDDSSQGSMV